MNAKGSDVLISVLSDVTAPNWSSQVSFLQPEASKCMGQLGKDSMETPSDIYITMVARKMKRTYQNKASSIPVPFDLRGIASQMAACTLLECGTSCELI